MNHEKVKEIAISQLRRFFIGVSIHGYTDQYPANSRVLTVNEENKFRISRPQPFDPDESKLIKATGETLKKIFEFDSLELVDDLEDVLPIRTIANYFNQVNPDFDTAVLFDLLQTINGLASQTYEGRRISISVGINPDVDGSSQVHMSKYLDNDYSKVISYSLETIIEFGRDGHLNSYIDANVKDETIFSPYYYSSLATKADSRLVASLNFNGDILIFHKKQLLFSKRRNQWRYYQFSSILQQVSFGNRFFDEGLRKAILLSALDVSFAKSGGCIAYIHSDKTQLAIAKLSESDKMSGNSEKSQTFRALISGATFQNLSRLKRKELLAVDGATILKNTGEIVAVGAIIKLDSRSDTGGGRTAAAIELGKLGTAFKISNDGPIIAYDDDKFLKVS
jgi:hypothetical protein